MEHATGCPMVNHGVAHGSFGGVPDGELKVNRGLAHGVARELPIGICQGKYPWVAPWSTMDDATARAMGHRSIKTVLDLRRTCTGTLHYNRDSSYQT